MSARVALQVDRPGWLRRLFGPEVRKPALPAGRRVFAIGDVHGRRDLLEPLLDRISVYADANPAQNVLVFLGDYVDRGPDSKGVVDTLLALQVPGWVKVFLKGNHDQALLDFLNDPAFYRIWRNFGAAETLLSYGVRPPLFDDPDGFVAARDEFVQKLPPSHRFFFEDLKLRHDVGDYLFVHAGVRPGVPLDEQMPEDLLWIRDEFLLSQKPLEKIVVHGHTPSHVPVKRLNRIGVDTGAYFTGCLTAAVLEGDLCVFLSGRDR